MRSVEYLSSVGVLEYALLITTCMVAQIEESSLRSREEYGVAVGPLSAEAFPFSVAVEQLVVVSGLDEVASVAWGVHHRVHHHGTLQPKANPSSGHLLIYELTER